MITYEARMRHKQEAKDKVLWNNLALHQALINLGYEIINAEPWGGNKINLTLKRKNDN